MKILGIDPGSQICGYGVIYCNLNKISLIEYGVVNLKKKSNDLPTRLKEIFNRLTEVIIRTKPDFSAFESVFYSKNAQSMMKLSHARAAAILTASLKDIPIAEYSPREIKKSVTGMGNASKEQVQFMVKNLLNIEETNEFFDATDALAVAICHSFRLSTPTQKSKSWEEFIKQNPNRIVKY